MKQHYKTLEVEETATLEEIKASYRALSKENHPDKGGDQEKQTRINEAYTILSDPEKKAFYDEYGLSQEPISIEDAAIGQLEEVFKMLFTEELVEDNLFILAHNGMERAIAETERNREELEREVDRMNRKLESIRVLRGKIKPGMDILRKAVHWKIRDIEIKISEIDIKQYDFKIAVHKKTLEILQKSYPREIRRQSPEDLFRHRGISSILYRPSKTTFWGVQ